MSFPRNPSTNPHWREKAMQRDAERDRAIGGGSPDVDGAGNSVDVEPSGETDHDPDCSALLDADTGRWSRRFATDDDSLLIGGPGSDFL